MRLGKTLFLLASTVLFALMLSQKPLAQSNPRNQFSILYTNDVMGEVEPCG